MTKKKYRRDLGKRIRRATGVPLPVAMQAAKLIASDRTYDLKLGDRALFTGWIKSDVFCTCCGPENWRIEGPKGEWGFN